MFIRYYFPKLNIKQLFKLVIVVWNNYETPYVYSNIYNYFYANRKMKIDFYNIVGILPLLQSDFHIGQLASDKFHAW